VPQSTSSQSTPPARSISAGRLGGFTLVEIMIVVLLMAMLASAAALSMNGPLTSARAADAAEMVSSFDAAVRIYARRYHSGAQIVFDLSAGKISRRQKHDNLDDHASTFLPSGFSIDEIRQAQHLASVGETHINVSAMGLSPSYAVHLLGPRSDQWLVFAGLSGQVRQVNNEAAIDAILTSSGKAAIADGLTLGGHAD
jgi:prepilin-type N-terminal cleavage/methylation domain-containing protein